MAAAEQDEVGEVGAAPTPADGANQPRSATPAFVPTKTPTPASRPSRRTPPANQNPRDYPRPPAAHRYITLPAASRHL